MLVIALSPLYRSRGRTGLRRSSIRWPELGRLCEMLPRTTPIRLTPEPVRNILNMVQFPLDGFGRAVPPVLMLNTSRLANASAGAAGDGKGAPGSIGAPADGSTNEVLDAQAIARLRELDPSGEGKLLQRVLQAFETSVARLLPQLKEARASGDLATVRHVAHTLKSSSASIGALKLSQLCADIEIMVRESRAERLDDAIDAMILQLGIVPEALKKLLDPRS
jgi:HPt (histidine-containing phosphotransfer) domain-containing protein